MATPIAPSVWIICKYTHNACQSTHLREYYHIWKVKRCHYIRDNIKSNSVMWYKITLTRFYEFLHITKVISDSHSYQSYSCLQWKI